METNQAESVTQTDVSGASPEKENLSKPEMDYKRDMLRYKDEVNALREQLKEIQLSDEQKKGNLEGVITTLKDEIKTLKHQNATDRFSYAESQLNGSIEREIISRGVKEQTDIDAFMKLVDKADKEIVELDKGFNANQDDVKGLVDKYMERYGKFFKSNVKVVDKTPNTQVASRPAKGFNLQNATAKETIEYMLKNKDKLK